MRTQNHEPEAMEEMEEFSGVWKPATALVGSSAGRDMSEARAHRKEAAHAQQEGREEGRKEEDAHQKAQQVMKSLKQVSQTICLTDGATDPKRTRVAQRA